MKIIDLTGCLELAGVRNKWIYSGCQLHNSRLLPQAGELSVVSCIPHLQDLLAVGQGKPWSLWMSCPGLGITVTDHSLSYLIQATVKYKTLKSLPWELGLKFNP